MITRIIIVLLSACAMLQAATYHVSTTNVAASDDNAGTQALPWATITKGVATATAGDLVYVWPGTYYESVTNLNSGTAGNPITFTGFRGASGEWLTTIDAGVSISNGWTSLSNGIYWRQDMPSEIHELTIDGLKVWRAWTNGELPQAGGLYTNLSTGLDLLSIASDAQFKTTWSTAMVTFWDGIEAMYCSVSNTCWLRLRDGSDPNGLNIRGGISVPRTTGQSHPAISMRDISHVVWSNLSIRGSSLPVRIDYISNVTIASNRLVGGDMRVYIGYECKDNFIVGNELTADLYGSHGTTNLGAWLTEGDPSPHTRRMQNYLVSKLVTGSQGNTLDDGVYISNSSSNNIVAWNTIHDQAGECVYIGGQVARPVSHTLVFSNHCYRSSDVGVILLEGQTETRVFRNQIEDCDIGLRYHRMDYSTETNRTVYVYRNTVRQPEGFGNCIYVHFNNATEDVFHPTYWTYHNTFSGGQAGLQVSAYAVGSGGLPNCRWVNNVFNGAQYIVGASFGGQYAGFWTNSAQVGAFDYNIITPPLVTYPSTNAPAWVGANNVFTNAVVWPVASANFTPPARSVVVDSSLPVNVEFTLNGDTFPALPDDQPGYGAGWEIGAIELKATATAGAVRVGVLISKGQP